MVARPVFLTRNCMSSLGSRQISIYFKNNLWKWPIPHEALYDKFLQQTGLKGEYMFAPWKIIPTHFKSNIPLENQDIYWQNFNIKVCKDKAMKQYLGDKQKGYCAWCGELLSWDRIIHHINYYHKCTKKQIKCKQCGNKKQCAKNLALVHSNCNKTINDIQLYLCDRKNFLKELNNRKNATDAYKHLKVLIPVATRTINLWMFCGYVIIVSLKDSSYKVISLNQLPYYDINSWKLFHHFKTARYLKKINKDWINIWLEKEEEIISA